MITKHLASLTSTFNPLSRSRAHKIPRLVLSFLSADARTPAGGSIAVSSKILPSHSTAPASLLLVFKDGKQLMFEEGAAENRLNLAKLGLKDVTDEMDRLSRVLQRKAELSGS